MNKNLLWAMMPLMSACAGQSEEQKPNIIYIMCDDLGYIAGHNKPSHYILNHRT